MTKKRKRSVRGKDWHGWAFKDDAGWFCHYAEVTKPRETRAPTDTGKWVKVKFVEVP